MSLRKILHLNLMDEIPHLGHQLRNPERLRNDRIHTRIDGDRNLLRASISRNGNNGDMGLNTAFGLTLADMADTRQAVHSRHFEVEEDDIQTGSGFAESRFLQERETFFAVVGEVDDAAGAAELLGHDFLVDEVIFHHEDVE